MTHWSATYMSELQRGLNGIVRDDFAGVYRDNAGNVIPKEIMTQHRMRQQRLAMRNRYEMGWVDPRAGIPAKPSIPEVDLSFLESPKGIRLRWYHRLLWRVVRWARGAM